MDVECKTTEGSLYDPNYYMSHLSLVPGDLRPTWQQVQPSVHKPIETKQNSSCSDCVECQKSKMQRKLSLDCAQTQHDALQKLCQQLPKVPEPISLDSSVFDRKTSR